MSGLPAPDGVDRPALISLPAVGDGSVHLYPENWGGLSSADPIGWGVAWIDEHRRIAAKAKKPMVLGESASVLSDAVSCAVARSGTLCRC